MDNLKKISEIIQAKKELLTLVSDRIWEYAELKFEEYKSADLLCETLENEGFKVERNVAGMETAFIGRFGSGKPVIAIMGEFDALYGMSQVGGATSQEPVVNGGAGHGCGHQLLGTGSLAAAIALRYYMAENDLSGTVLYLGCPGEEGGFGKTYMVRDGVFNGVDCALTWHPASGSMVPNESSLANFNIYYRFKGKSSHAAFAPHLGRSALDALELMNVGVNYLREHVVPDVRMHYAITNTGGKSPNVVQAESEEYFCMRSPKMSQLREIFDRVSDVARGAALMTGTTVEYEIDSAVSEAIPNKTLNKQMHSNFSRLGMPEYDSEDHKVAEEFRSILPDAAKKNVPPSLAGNPVVLQALLSKPIMDMLVPYSDSEGITMGSTDVADVSWVVPTAQCWVTCAANGTQLHSWEMVAQGKTSIAHKGMLHAGKVIAATAVDILLHPEILEKAKNELKERLGDQAYICPIPENVKPSKTGKG
jgi:aminobenzoyl-glutamate utilization protein B